MARTVPCTAEIVTGTFEICVNGSSLGCTNGGVNIKFERSYEDIRCDQSYSLIARFLTEQTLMIEVNILEPTLDKLRFIYGQEDYDSEGGVLCIADPGNCSFPDELSLEICGPGPGCGCRLMSFPRVIITPTNVDYNITKDSPVEITVEFTVLPSCPEGILGCISDVCDFECANTPLALGPRASVFNAGPLNGQITGSLSDSVSSGDDSNMTFELVDPTDPCADSITINPDGTFTISE